MNSPGGASAAAPWTGKAIGRVSAWLERQWYGGQAPNPALLPFEFVFKAVAERRRRAYAAGRRASGRLPVPVIVVGNLSVGGTGKTPMTIWLAQTLRSRGYSPGIVSRGYGGQSGDQPLFVDRNSDPIIAGDEPVLLARRAQCPVWVGRKRYETGLALLAGHDCNVILADDGLQHYALQRDVEIALVDGMRGLGNGRCLPAGPLREPPERLNTVDFVVHTGGPARTAWTLRLQGDTAVGVDDETRRRPLSDFSGLEICAAAAIGNPERFFAHLRSLGLQFKARAFPDHHRFRREDFAFAQDRPLLVTEKDAVKCAGFADLDLWCVPVEALLDPGFEEELLKRLAEKSHGPKAA